MTAARDGFLQRVKAAVVQGNQGAPVPPLPERGKVGYQGSGADPVARLRDELTAAGALLHLVAGEEEARQTVLSLVQERAARRLLLGGGRIDSLKFDEAFGAAGIEVDRGDAGRAALFSADVGVSGVDGVIAETGTLVLHTRPDQPRAVSLLPPVHIAVAWRDQIVADLFDLFPAELPACLQLITGPSKTGDIELKLVTGVHGPGEVHVVLIDP